MSGKKEEAHTEIIIKIARIDTPPYTVKWLLNGLESGALEIKELLFRYEAIGVTTAPVLIHHALVLTGAEMHGYKQFLASYNEYGLTSFESSSSNRYAVVDHVEKVNAINCSDQCWELLLEIAEQWVDQMNLWLDDERAPCDMVKIVCVKQTEAEANEINDAKEDAGLHGSHIKSGDVVRMLPIEK